MNNTPQIHKSYDLLTCTLDDPIFTIPDLLPVGLGILGGRPKVGKSWLALQIAYAVGAGGYFLDKKIDKGKVLYLALEDSPRRLQSRMKKLNWNNDPSIDVDFIILNDFLNLIGQFHLGGAINLRDNFIIPMGYKMVVIDTLSRAFMGIKDIDRNQEVTKALSPIQEIAHQTNCSILIIDHHNKNAEGNNPNPINDILGSTAKGAVLDTAWGLYREKGKHTSNLMIIGRDVEEQTIILKKDFVTMAWQLDDQNNKSSNPLNISPLQQKLIDFLGDNGESTYSEIIKQGGFNRSNAWYALADLRALGEINFDSNTRKYYL